MTTTLFTWGYYGWGNHTPQLIEAVDSVERSRGFEPPFFVDIRIRRTVRAKGFQGNAFEKLLGPERHRWMKSLGNRFIETRTGPNIQIADPSAADELLDLAQECADRRHNDGCRTSIGQNLHERLSPETNLKSSGAPPDIPLIRSR